MPSIALIGPGRHGTAIASLFAAHGTDVVLFHYKPEKAQAAAAAANRVARGAVVTVADSLEAAVDGQEFVILATLWDKPQREVLEALSGKLAGKVLLDISNPLDVTPFGIVPREPKEGSAGQFVHTLLPHGVGHAKAFSNLATVAINEGADHEPPAVLPFLADSADTAKVARKYLDSVGWKAWLVGGIDRSRELEIGGKFNAVFGAYGRSRLNEREIVELDGPEKTL